jgi:hypothetical protein
MTIKEIAELCGVEVHTVRNWINKDNFLRENFTLRNKIKEKLEGGSPERPSDYDLDETLAIIGEGGGNKVLAALLAENAENKVALALRQPVPTIPAPLMGLPALMERLEKALEDPQKAAYEELEAFVKRTLTPEEKPVHKTYLFVLWHAYEKEVKNLVDKHVFMYKIAMDHPEFKLKHDKHGWYFAYCDVIRLI